MRTAQRWTLGLTLSAFLAAGCGGTPTEVEYKPTQTDQFADMSKAMMKNVQSKNYRNAPKK